MSMISEFVKKLRFYASEYNELPYGREVEGTGDLLKEAADIIEELSAKLASANMERSEQYYKGNSEFVEKLIGRLEEKQDEYFHGTSDYEEGKYNAYDEVAQIVNQFAEEYNQENDDTDYANIELYAFWQKHQWIPCSERLPENTDPVNITWVNHNPEPYYADIKDKPFTATGCYCDGKWYWYSAACQAYLDEYRYSDNDYMDDGIEVTAWQPLPQPHKGEYF